MTATWDFNKDEFPTTVRGLMSLWGGFDEPANVTDSGCEKRLEVDLCVPSEGPGMLCVEDQRWDALFLAINEAVVETKKHEGLHWYRTPQCMAVVTREKVIVTASAVTLLHRLVKPLIQLCNQTGGSTVEWASFMRKNLASPWEPDNEMNHVMASEYAELKQVFSQGRSFLIGPVDGDHYFYFVYDALDRKSGAVVENDAQVNLVMYNVTDHKDDDCEENKITQRCTPLNDNGEYEALRFFYACGSRCVTFETNATDDGHADRIAKLLTQYQPDRYTLITLFDPSTAVAQRFAQGDRCGLDKFDHYTVENCCTNEFAYGYTVRKTMFVRSN